MDAPKTGVVGSLVFNSRWIAKGVCCAGTHFHPEFRAGLRRPLSADQFGRWKVPKHTVEALITVLNGLPPLPTRSRWSLLEEGASALQIGESASSASGLTDIQVDRLWVNDKCRETEPQFHNVYSHAVANCVYVYK